MDINAYVDKITESGGSLTLFAQQAGISRMYLHHIIKGRKPKPGIESILKILVASGGEVNFRTLRPDLFPKGKAGRDALKILRKSLT